MSELASLHEEIDNRREFAEQLYEKAWPMKYDGGRNDNILRAILGCQVTILSALKEILRSKESHEP